MKTRSLFAPFLTLLALALPAFAQTKVELDKELKVKEWGYLIRPLKGWNSMPADQEDRYAVGRWKLAMDEFEKRGDWDMMRSGQFCELKIMRIQLQVETPTGQTASGPAAGEPAPKPAAFSSARDYKNVEEWIEATWSGASKRWLRTPIKGGKMAGDLYEFGAGSSSVTIGVFRYLGVEWAVTYTCFEETYKKTWKDWYFKSIQSFKVYENVDPAVADASRKDINQLEGEEKRAALNATIAGKPGWFAVNTKYYVFLSNADRQFVEKLAKDLEVVREKVYVPTFKPRNQKIPLNPVRVFATQSEYHQFGGPGGSAGYFSPSKGELVLFQKFEDLSSNKSKDDCRSVMFHEGLHQYVHFAIGDVSPHSWFNEGHGDYFAGLNVSGGSIGKTQLFSWRVDYLKQHMREGNDLVPLRSLLRYSQGEYYSNAGLKYSQGWALIYYLREVNKDKTLKDALDTYFNYLADNVAAFRSKKKGEDDDGGFVPGSRDRIINFEDMNKVQEILSQAVDKAFAKVDLEKLDKDLRNWIQSL